MNRLRGALVGVGTAGLLAAVGLVVLGALGWHPLSGATVSLVLAAVFAITTAAMVGGIHWGEGVQRASVDAAESTVATPRPGVELRALDGGRWPVGARRRAAIRDRLRHVAVRTLVRERDISADAAARRLDDGTWTDDPDAAVLFAPREGPLDRLREPVRFRRRARRAAQVIDRLARGGR